MKSRPRPSFEPIVEEKPEQLVVSGFEPSFETGFEPGVEQVVDSSPQATRRERLYEMLE